MTALVAADEEVLHIQLESLRDEARLEHACLSANPDARAMQLIWIESARVKYNALVRTMFRAGYSIANIPEFPL